MNIYEDIDLGLVEGQSELITASEVKDWAGIDTDADDTLINGIITSARRIVENYTGLTLLAYNKKLYFDTPDFDGEKYYVTLPWSANPRETITVVANDTTLTEDSNYEIYGLAVDYIEFYAKQSKVTITYVTNPLSDPSKLQVAKDAMKVLIEKIYNNRALLEDAPLESLIDSNLKIMLNSIRDIF